MARSLLEFAERLGRRPGAVGEGDQRLGDLLGSGGLGPHPLVYMVKPRRQALHLADHVGELTADPRDPLHPRLDLSGECLHLRHACAHRLLHLLDEPLDVEGRDGRLVGEPADLPGHDDEALAVLARLLGLDRGVDREEIGLVGHLRDRRDHHVDVLSPLADEGQSLAELVRRLLEVVHRLPHLPEVLAPRIGHRRRVVGDRGHVVHRGEELTTGDRNLAAGSRRLGGAGPERIDRLLLVRSGGREIAGRGPELATGLLHLLDDAPQALRHVADIPEQLARLVAPALVEAPRQVARSHPASDGGGRRDPAPDPVGQPGDQARQQRQRCTSGEQDVKHWSLDPPRDLAPREFDDHRPAGARALGPRKQTVGTVLDVTATDDRGGRPHEPVDDPHPGRLGESLPAFVGLGFRAGDHPSFGAHHRDRCRPSGLREAVTDLVEASIEILER